MAYATITNLIDRFGADEITNLTGGGDVPDAGRAGAALDDASGTVDSYCAARYQVPLAPVPVIVVRWTCDIARFFLWSNEESKTVTARYKAAMAALVSVQAGDITLESAGVATAESGDAVMIITGSGMAPQRTFTPYGGPVLGGSDGSFPALQDTDF